MSEYGMRVGLPRQLGPDPEGVDRLLGLLAENRHERRRLVSRFKGRKMLHAAHCDPKRRRTWWAKNLKRQQGHQPKRVPLPSLEFLVLERYVAAGDGGEIETVPAEAFDRWPGLAERFSGGDDEAAICARALRDLESDFGAWAELGEGQRRETALRAFSVATVLDDRRFLIWAVRRVSDLSGELAGLLEESEQAPGVIEKWRELTASLRLLATRAEGPPPDANALAEIEAVVEALRKLRPEVGDWATDRALGRLKIQVLAQIERFAGPDGFPWFDDELRWRLVRAWEARWAEWGPSLCDGEIKRLPVEVKAAVDIHLKAVASLEQAAKALEALGPEPPAMVALARLEEWDHRVSEQTGRRRTALRKERESRLAICSALSPLGEPFDPDAPPPEPPPPEPDPEPEPEPEPEVELQPEPRPEPTPEPTPEPEPEPDPVADAAVERLVKALSDEPPRLGFALQVRRLLDLVDAPVALPPTELFEAAALAEHLRLPTGAIANELHDVFERFPQESSYEEANGGRDAHVLLALAGALRPAMLAPRLTGALDILETLRPTDAYHSVYRFAEAVASRRRRFIGNPIALDALGEGPATDWSDRRAELGREAGEWRERAPHFTIKYVPMTKAWQIWTQPDGHIDRLTAPIAAGEVSPAASDRIRELAEPLRTRKALEKLLRQPGTPIPAKIHLEYKAVDQLHAHALEAVAFADRYLQLLADQPSPPDYVAREVAALRDEIANGSKPAIGEMREHSGSDGAMLAGARNAALHGIEALQAATSVRNGGAVPGSDGTDAWERHPVSIYAAGLDDFPDVEVGADGTPTGDAREILEALVSPARAG